MAISTGLDAKTIDQLQELGKITGREKTIVSDGKDTRKVTIDTIIGYAAGVLSGSPARTTVSNQNTNTSSLRSQCIFFVPKGEEVSVSERSPGTFYLEESDQTSIRTQINLPTTVTVSKSLGLKRV